MTGKHTLLEAQAPYCGDLFCIVINQNTWSQVRELVNKHNFAYARARVRPRWKNLILNLYFTREIFFAKNSTEHNKIHLDEFCSLEYFR